MMVRHIGHRARLGKHKMSRFPEEDFESTSVGNLPSGWSGASWTVQDDGGNNVVKNSADGFLYPPTFSYLTEDNFILRFKVKYVSGTYNRWFVMLRYDGGSNFVYIGCIASDDHIDIYEYVSGTPTPRVSESFSYSGLHDVEVVCQDGSIVVRIDSTEINYDSLAITSGSTRPIFNANSNSIIEFDDVSYITMDYPVANFIDDNFNDNDLNSQWRISYDGVSGTSFAETGSELKYSGTPDSTAYVFICTNYTTKRRGFYQQMDFEAPTTIDTNKEILFRLDSGSLDFVEISIQADGYRVEKVEDGSQPPGSTVGPVALIGDEDNTFHTLKILWDEIGDKVWGWIDSNYIGRLEVDTSTFLDAHRPIIHINNTASSAIDRRFEDFMVRTDVLQTPTAFLWSNF